MKKIAKKSIGDIVFTIKSKTGAVISTTRGYWNIITQVKHPSVQGKEKQVMDVLSLPEEIRISKKDVGVYLFYKKHGTKFLCVVARIYNGKGFIITVYYTEKIKEGQLKWKK